MTVPDGESSSPPRASGWSSGDRSGGPTHDLRDTYETGSTRALDELIGEHVPGDWKLHVTDLASRDVGRLDHWSIEVDWTLVGNKLEKRMTPEAAIPGNDTTGITSTIGFDGPGAVHGIEVDVDIAHTFVGDLQVELVAPSGRIVSLHDREGGAQHNLVATWTSSSHAGLAGLVGEAVDGGWMLRVRDVAREDSGVLRAWVVSVGREVGDLRICQLSRNWHERPSTTARLHCCLVVANHR